MDPYTYFPRLHTSASRTLLVEYTGLPILELAARASTSSDQAYWYPTAPTGQRAGDDLLGAFRAAVVDVARRHGYPEIQPDRSPARGQFDRDLVEQIGPLLPMLPVEAAQEAVWSFLTLVVAPDVALWRWPNTKQRDDYERILGYPRNVFRRLWWRSYALGPSGVAEQILEDEAVAILERTSIGGNLQLARAIAEIQVGRFGKSARRTEIMRDAMKRIRRRNAFVATLALTKEETESLVNEAFDEASDLLLGTAD